MDLFKFRKLRQLGRRTAEVRKSTRNLSNCGGNPSGGKNQHNNNNNVAPTNTSEKKNAATNGAAAPNKKKSGSKGKNNDSINLAKAILHNLNIFGE